MDDFNADTPRVSFRVLRHAGRRLAPLRASVGFLEAAVTCFELVLTLQVIEPAVFVYIIAIVAEENILISSCALGASLVLRRRGVEGFFHRFEASTSFLLLLSFPISMIKNLNFLGPQSYIV